MSSDIQIRRARLTDAPALREVHSRSLRRLGSGHYPRETLEAVIAAGTLQPALLHAGHYLVAVEDGHIVGCGGWLDQGASAPLAASSVAPTGATAQRQPAIIRAVYVDPAYARQGIGRRLMAAIETDATAFGKVQAEVLATHMAVRFFGSLGYAMKGPLSLALPGAQLVDVFAMRKTLAVAPFSTMRAMRRGPGSLASATAA